MAAAASALPRPSLYGIGSLRVDGRVRYFDIGWDEFERDVDWAETTLRASGITTGDLVLITSPNCEGPWTSPVVHGLRRIGAVYMTAEQFAWDARRVATFMQRLPIKAVLGLGQETLEGLGSIGTDPAELFSGVDIIWTRHEVLKTVHGIGLPATPFVLLGPALAMGVSPGNEALVNDAEWTVTAHDGRLTVATASLRAARFEPVPTGVAGEVRTSADQGIVVAF